MRDTTVTKRQPPKQRKPPGILEPIKEIARDIYAGFGELKRQSGTAVARIKEGVEKVKRAVKP